jgi:hypothetical protein
VLVNLAALFVVFAIYDAIYGSFETIAVSMLVLIYVSIVALGAGLGQIKMQDTLFIHENFKRLRKLLNENQSEYELEAEAEDLKGATEKMKTAQVKFFINAGFNFIIFVIAILNLLGAL